MRKSNMIEAIYPLSPLQQGMLFHSLYEPDSNVYFEQLVFALHGDLDSAALQRAWEHVVERHPTLRTIFVWEGRDKPLQVVRRQTRLGWEAIDWRTLPAAEHAARLAAFLQADRKRGFALAKAPPMRLFLIQLDGRTYRLVWSHHHLLLDGWSTQLVLQEVFACYEAFRRGEPAALAPSRSYEDYIVWLQAQDLAAAEAFWRRYLHGFAAPTPLGVTRTHAQGDDQPPHSGEQKISLPAAATAALYATARQHHLTLSTLVQGAWAVLLSRYSGENNIVFGVTVSGRPPELAGVETMVGLFINTLPVRVRLSPAESALSLLQALQAEQVELRRYEYSPLVQVQRWSDVPRGQPLFNSILIFESRSAEPVAQHDGSLEVRPVGFFERTNYPLAIAVVAGAELAIEAAYDQRRFEPLAIARMLRHLQILLRSIAAEPRARIADLALLSAAERQQLLHEWNDTATRVRSRGSGVSSSIDACLHQLVAAQAARTPDRIAVVFDAATKEEGRRRKDEGPQTADCRLHMTYAELNTRANQLAHHLRALGAGPETCIAVGMAPAPELLVALLGILKAGGAYLPLDPAYPAERLAFMLDDSRAHVLITTNDERPTTNDETLAANCRPPTDETAHLGTLAPCHLVDLKGDWPIIAQRPEVPPAGTATAANLAYIIYTSGSTGRPKGVQILHGALVNFLHAMRQQPGLAEQDVLVAVTTVSFDIAALELFLPLLAGARVVLAGRAAATDAALHEVLFNARATIMQATPTTWRLLVEAEDADRRGIDRLTALCGGEALPRTLADRLLECAASLWNLYGPTETTIWSTAARLASEDGPAPIGRPIANTLIYLLDADLEPVPIGVAGELYIGGAGLARGYLNRPDLTAARFIPNPFAEVSGIGYRVLGAEPSDTQYPTPDTRLYKTGDLGRYRHDGTMVYLGRRDGQVKLRGVRIELGEIAAALERHPMVRACAVVLRAGPARGAEPRLVAYVVPVQGIGVWKQGSGVPGFLNGDERGTTNDERRTIEDRGLKIEDSDAGVSESLSSILYPLSSDLREFLAARLPSSMIPADFVLLDALPRTPNGKLDRAALPAPAAPAVATAHAAPRTPAEAQLAQIWGAVLGLERVGIHDDFFALGGHSLRAAQVIARVRRECGVELPLRALFAHPTVALLARQLAQAQRAAAGTPLPPLRPMPRPPILPLSFAQQWLWLVEQLAPGSPQYNIPAALRLRGELDIDALARSLGTIIARHEALRTTFALVDGQPAQVIAPPARAGAAGLPLVDLQALEAPRRATVERELAEAEARRHFELGRAPLVRSALLRLGPCEHTLLLNVHHMIADGWSIGVFVRELAALYAAAVAGQPAALPDLPIQYADYTLWQREWLRGAGDHAQSTLQEQLAYWRAQLAGLPALNLPVDRPRPPVRTTNGATQELWLPGDLAGTLVALSRGQGVTLFMLLLAAWARLLADYSGQDDIAIGTPVAGRGQVETEDLIGFFANTLVLRLDLSGDPTFVELLGRVREVCLGAYAHQDLPFERLVAALAPEQDPSRTPLFQVSFGLNNATSQRLNLPGLTVDAEQLDTGTAKFDLALDVEERADGLAAIMQYSTDLFDAGTIGGMLDQFRALLQTIATEER